MVSRRDWYARTEKEWPATVPPLTVNEATKAAKRLWRFATGHTPKVQLVSGNRRTSYHNGRLVVNADAGWKVLVHSLSHWAAYVNPYKAGTPGEHGQHSKAHARLEARMIRQVVRRGWLDGKLKVVAKLLAPLTAEQIQAAVESKFVANADRLVRLVKKAETRLKRAITLHKKWLRRLQSFQKKHGDILERA